MQKAKLPYISILFHISLALFCCFFAVSSVYGADRPKPKPNLLIQVYADDRIINENDLANYTYKVYFGSSYYNVSLKNIKVTDDKCQPVRYQRGDRNNNNTMETDELWEYKCSISLSEDTENTAAVTGTTPSGQIVTATDSTSVAVSHQRNIIYTLVVTVVDEITGEKIRNALVSFAGNDISATDGTARFQSDLDPASLSRNNPNIKIKAEAEGYRPGYFQDLPSVLRGRLNTSTNEIPVRIKLEKKWPETFTLWVYLEDDEDEDETIYNAKVKVNYLMQELTGNTSNGKINFTLRNYPLGSADHPMLEVKISVEAPYYQPSTRLIKPSDLRDRLRVDNTASISIYLVPEDRIDRLEIKCDPKEIFEDETSTCKAVIYFESGNTKDVSDSDKTKWTPDYVDALNGTVKGESVKNVHPLPHTLDVKATYKAPPEDGGRTWNANSSVLVKPRPSIPAPAIKIRKTASPLTVKKGDKVTYTYKVSNSGNIPLTQISVNDDKCNNVLFITASDSNHNNKLDVNETWTYECSMTLNADTTNSATAKATGPAGNQVSDQAAATVSIGTGAPTDCPPPKVWVPHVVYISESEARELITNNNLRYRVTEREHSSRYEAGEVMDQSPNPGECVDPDTEIKVKVSLGPPEIQSEVFKAKFDCGDSFELSPNDILYPKICHVLVSGYNNNDERVRVTATYDSNILTLFPENQSAPPYLMYPSTAGPTSGYYAFSINFSTSATAPEGETAVVITVSQGASSITIPVTILVLPPGRDASRGTGIRPPVELATGSGEFCVWRYKKFRDPPRCFAFVLAACDTAAYNSNDKYELVGSNMSDLQAAVLMSDLSPYGGDAYGCHRRPQDEAPVDNCPTDDNKTEPGMCGCNNPDVDSDSDGVCDHEDICRGDDSSGDPDSDGICTNLDDCLGNDSSGDSDGDGVCNDRDPCPYDNPDNQDTDGDGTDDCNEECDNDPNKIAPGTCGCGVPDVDSDGDGIFDCQELVCTGNMEEFNGRCVSRCARGERRNADGTCVFDPSADLADTGVPTCMSNDECPENYICVTYKCIPSEIHEKTKERIGEGRDDRPPRGPESGATGGGAPSPTGDYGTGECSYDADCPYDDQICQNNKCVSPDYPPYPPPHHRRDRHGKDVEDFVDDFLDGEKDRRGRDGSGHGGGGRGGSGGTGGRRGTGGSGGVSSQPETSGGGDGPQPETPPQGPKPSKCLWSGTMWQIGGIEWKCLCSGKEQSATEWTKMCGPYPKIDKNAKTQKVNGSKYSWDVTSGIWDKDNPGRCIVWGINALVLKDAICREIGMK